ncbi:MAG: phosphoribosyl-ATP diphosphatase [Polycyclovorans sp.]|jgi:phosphoribosyl-ATP pyrophosphohydrolase|nr:phosphoribosyl-ATP diphosphatase [Polycyclovorans sp.]MBU0790031.1 phosphoribosyl-ATP diphosphatase [Gammaproteobacteria bacterium]MDP1542003.1 phosphoribosyl-ATP diphosphatase [Polycyclovorans sp.]MEC8849493.1 phosphoribosyl-ATP diphosphatase [Pseudomonadota bacterium]|tara:strand:+ start:7168 stop:7494 length:327 start_codon:yes stop_codon:yes gene_type:complete
MPANDILTALVDVIRERQKCADPAGSYVASLMAKGDDAILKKVGEEAAEVLLAAKNGAPGPLSNEVADLWFHTLVLLVHKGLSLEDVTDVLAQRFGLSGHAEKAARNN